MTPPLAMSQTTIERIEPLKSLTAEITAGQVPLASQADMVVQMQASMASVVHAVPAAEQRKSLSSRWLGRERVVAVLGQGAA